MHGQKHGTVKSIPPQQASSKWWKNNYKDSDAVTQEKGYTKFSWTGKNL